MMLQLRAHMLQLLFLANLFQGKDKHFAPWSLPLMLHMLPVTSEQQQASSTKHNARA